jgi:uncharacterized protein
VTSWKPDIMIYHANCADGFGAAWSAWMRWGDEVTYIPASYGDAPPDVLGKHVLIGDFSYKSDGLASLQGAASVVIIDHHKTAEEDLRQYRRFVDKPLRFTPEVAASMANDLRRNGHLPINALFDMTRSGAHMMWSFCFPEDPLPQLIRLIEDRDLWVFKLPETKAFGAWLRCEPFDFERWRVIAGQLENADEFTAIMAEAAAMQRFMDQKVREIAALARLSRVGSFTVPVCNCPPMFASEVGHALLQAHPCAPFAACYSDQGNARGWSLRSADDREDVSVIARKFGGGGHRNAAGFGVPLA